MSAKKAVSQKDMNGLRIVNTGDGTAATDVATKGQLDTTSTADRSRANHTGSQLANTISDFTTAVRLNALDQLAAPAGDLSVASHKLINVLDPTVAQDAATKSYVDASISTFSGGLVFKGKVRAATATNVSITSAPATIDGVTPTAGDVFLLMGQTTGTENGPRVWTAAGAAMNLPSNWDTTSDATPGSLWVVQQGTYDNQLAIMTNDAFTLGTSTAAFVFLNPAAAADNDVGYSETCPAVSAGGAWAVNHNLGTKLLQISVFRSASPYDDVEVAITRDTTNQINIKPDVATVSGEYTVVVSKVV